MTQPDRIANGMYWDRAWSLVEGCTPASEGCQHCWSAAATHMRAAQTSPAIRARYGGLTEKGPDGPRFCGRVRTMEADLAKPLHTRKSTTWAVWNDFFHPDVPDEFRDKAMAVMALCHQHGFLILTKRAERMLAYQEDGIARAFHIFEAIDDYGKLPSEPAPIFGPHAIIETAPPWPLPNVWLGVTAENQETADERIPLLLQTPAAVRYVSIEPLLGPVDLRPYIGGAEDRPIEDIVETVEGFGVDGGEPVFACARCGCRWSDGHECPPGFGPRLDWVIVGGETGPGARPMHPDWVRGIRDQCEAAGVPFFFKHHGEWLHESDVVQKSEIEFEHGDLFGNVVDGHWYRLKRHKPGSGPDRAGLLTFRDSDRIAEHIWPDGSKSIRVGRKAAGRLLDGRTHDSMPETGKEQS